MSVAPDSQRVAAGAIAGLLALARAFPQRLQAQREHRWLQLRREAAPADVQGQTVLLIGVGAVGAAVARFAQALDMRVIGVRRSAAAVAAVDEIHGRNQGPGRRDTQTIHTNRLHHRFMVTRVTIQLCCVRLTPRPPAKRTKKQLRKRKNA